MSQLNRQTLIRWALLLSVAVLVLLVLLLARQGRSILEPAGDYIQYWSAGRLNVHGQNPYDPQLVDELQEPYNPGEPPLFMWLMPWVHTIVMPFGLLPFQVSRMVWLLGEVAILFLCTSLIWQAYSKARRWLWLAWIIGFLHWAALEILRGGQISLLNLLGVVLYLFWIAKEKPFLAGASLAFITLKPHTLYLFSLVVFLWAWQQRKWPVLIGWAGAILAGVLIACLPNPALLGQYLAATQQQPPTQWITATIGGQLRAFFGAEYFWLQFLPSVFGLLWLAWYWRKHRQDWNWYQHTPLVLLVSVITMAYGWRHDQIVLLLPILQGFAGMLTAPLHKGFKTAWIGFYAWINWLGITTMRPQDWFWWLPIGILVWYLTFLWCQKPQQES